MNPAPHTYIETHSGRAFLPLEPDAGQIDIHDIAHALSHQCRFSGHTRVHYSVAEHCVRVAELLDKWGCTREEQLWGLLHDASEAYLVDIPLPLKHTPAFSAYLVAERALMVAVCHRFGLPIEQPEIVTVADRRLLATEARDLMPYVPEHWGTLGQLALGESIVPWRPEIARRAFLSLFEELYR